jgi:hypothetical protein
VLLQRERKLDTAAWLWPVASAAIGLLVAAILALQGWGLIRVARAGERTADPAAHAHHRRHRRRSATHEKVTA